MADIKDFEQHIFERVCQTIDMLSFSTVINMMAEFVLEDGNKLFEVVQKYSDDIDTQDNNDIMTRYILSLYIRDRICNGD